MTISSSANRIQYNGNGVTAAFSTGSIIFYDATDLVVKTTTIATGVDDATLTLTTDYTVTGGSGESGTVTLVAGALSAVKRITIERAIPYTQPDEFVEGENILAATIERRFDKATVQIQQVKGIADRGLLFPLSVASTISGTLPIPVDGYGIVWDGVAGAMRNTTVSIETLEGTAAAASASAAAASASAASAALAVENLSGTSTTSLAVGTGSKVFTTQSGKTFNGVYVTATSAGSPANSMHGLATYSGTTLTIDVTAITGTGTFADWILTVSGARGATGATGAAGAPGAGTGDVQGPVNVTDARIALFDGTSGDLLKEAAGGYGTMASQNSNGVSITGGTIVGITDLAIADGGTGASTAANARTNLDVYSKAETDALVSVFSAAYTSAEQTIVFDSTINLTHGLGAAPKLVRVTAICKTAELGYSIGDEVDISDQYYTSASLFSSGVAAVRTSTQVKLRIFNSISMSHFTTSARNALTAGNWKLIVRAWL